MQANSAFEQLWTESMGSVAATQARRGARLMPFLEALPKVDLHTHLNGSISNALLKYLSDLKFGPDSKSSKAFSCADTPASSLPTNPTERMQQCFGVFGAIYSVMDNLAFTRVAVQDVLWHYAAENAAYVEIRTSLREGMLREAVLLAPANNDANIDSEVPASPSPTTCSQTDYLNEVRRTISALQAGAVVSLLPPFDLLPPDTPSDDVRLVQTLKVARSIYGSSPFLHSDFFAVSPISHPPVAAFTILSPRPATVLMQRMCVRLLVSVNRGHPVAAARCTLEIATKLALLDHSASSPFSSTGYFNNHPFVVGVDLAGNPHTGDLPGLLDEFQATRTGGSALHLPLSMHAGEKADPEELRLMISHRPERWGHLVFTDEANVALLTKQASDHALDPHSPDTAPVVLELCLTSNLITSGQESVDEHHIDSWLDMGRLVVNDAGSSNAPDVAIPKGEKRPRTPPLRGTPHVSLHTDDRGVFNCSMSTELALLADHRGLFPSSLSDMEVASRLFHLQRNALEVVFAPGCKGPEEREEYITFLKARFDAQCRLPA